MLAYERLAEAAQSSRRTIADVVEVLCTQAGFGPGQQANVHVGKMLLPSGETVSLVQILLRTPLKTYIVSLPASSHLRVTRAAASSSPELFDVSRLHQATVDGDGCVHLQDGIRLRAVEVLPKRLPLHPSHLDWRIVHATVHALGAEKRCYRRPTDRTPKRFRRLRPSKRPRLLRRTLRHQRFLDCSALPGLNVPTLKELVYRLREIDPALSTVSAQTIANALRTFGIRIPPARPRRQTGLHRP